MEKILDRDIIEDTLIMNELLEEYKMGWSSAASSLFDGTGGYVEFINEKIGEFEEYWNEITKDGNYMYSIYEAMEEFVSKNAERWERELRGDHRYKIKVVLELDVEADKDVSIDNIVGQLDESIYVGDADNWELKDRRIINAIGKEVNE